MKKLFEMHVKATAFFGESDRSQETESVIRGLFYLPADIDLDTTTVGLQLQLEDFLWHLFTTIPHPASPLKLAAHKRKLDKIAEILNEALGKDHLPALSTSDIDLIKHLLANDEEFAKITIPFNAIPQSPLAEGEHVKAIPLPATNVLRDYDFVTTLDELCNATNE
jgi:hypothetical protein